MGIKKIAGRWWCRWWDELGRERSKSMPLGATKEDATSYLLGVKMRIDRIKAGLEVRERNPQGLTLAAVAKRYLRGKDDRLTSAINAHVINTALGALPIDEVTPPLITAHLEGLKPVPREKQRVKDNLSARTRNHVRKHLVQIFAFAIARGLYVGDNPARAVKPQAVRRKPLVSLTRDEAVRLSMAVEQPWRGIIAVALHGLRKGEVWGLDVEDVDLQRNELRVRRSHNRDLTKNGRERVVPIHPALRGAVAEAVELAAGRGGVLFPGLDGARRNERASVEVPYGRALRLAKIGRHVRFHDLRHTCATLLIQSGATLAHVKEVLGHSSIAVTVDLYGHLVTSDLHAAMARVDLSAPALRAVKEGM